jgi:hypothetical protein
MSSQYLLVLPLDGKPEEVRQTTPEGRWFHIQFRPNDDNPLLLLVTDLRKGAWLPLSARIWAYSSVAGEQVKCTSEELLIWENLIAPYFPNFIVNIGGELVLVWTSPNSMSWKAGFPRNFAQGSTPGEALWAFLQSRALAPHVTLSAK